MNKEMWKFFKKIFIFIFFIILLLLFFNKTHLKTSTSDTNNQVIVYYKDAFLFGPTEINVYYKKNSMLFSRKLFSTSINNDGATPTQDSVYCSWRENICSISLIGSEGASKNYQIIFDDDVTYK